MLDACDQVGGGSVWDIERLGEAVCGTLRGWWRQCVGRREVDWRDGLRGWMGRFSCNNMHGLHLYVVAMNEGCASPGEKNYLRPVLLKASLPQRVECVWSCWLDVPVLGASNRPPTSCFEQQKAG
eukprot:1156822-Pelagomonas_calceolata.AAC.2